MRVSIRQSFGAAPTVHDFEWHQVCDLYRQHLGVPFRGDTRTEKPHDLPLIAFCAFDQHDLKGAPGCRRGNMSPEGLWAIALDFDDADPGVFARVLENAKRMSPQGLVHTTWKHGLSRAQIQSPSAPAWDGTVRARIVMPLTALDRAALQPVPKPMPAAQWVTYWGAVVQALEANEPGSGLDTQCHNPERLWYLPCTNLDAPAWAPHLEVWG